MASTSDFGGIEITYRLSDLYAVTLHAWRHFLRVPLILEAFWLAVMIVIDLIDGASILEAIRWIPWPLLGWAALALLAFWFGLCPPIRYVRARRTDTLGPTGLRLSESGIEIETANINSLVRWPAIKRIARSRNRTFLFVSSASAVILPRRAFDTNSQFDHWSEYVAGKIHMKSVTVE
jgi:hypothetical protein